MSNTGPNRGEPSKSSSRWSHPQPDPASNHDPDTSNEDWKDLQDALEALVDENKIIWPKLDQEGILVEVRQNPTVDCSEQDDKDENMKTGPGGLPEEVWEKILEYLEDSKNILNFFKAIPELEGRILKNRCQWLSDQVVPHIFLLLNKRDMLACRLVCKNWNFGVTNFVENHPSRRAYNPAIQLTGQHWIPQASKLYEDVTEHFQRLWPCMPYESLQRQVGIDLHPPSRNPFFGRAIRIIDRLCSYRDGYASIEAYWNDVQTSRFLRIFGSHIWYLTIGIGTEYYHRDPLFFFQLLEQILSHVPNLKSLIIHGNPGLSMLLKKRMAELGMYYSALPVLHQLESLEVRLDPMLDYFLPAYSQQIRWLKTEIWRIDLCCHFPKLREFDLHRSWPLSVITSTIANLITPELSILSFSVAFCNLSAIETEIIPVLSGFRKLQSLTIRLNWIRDGRQSFKVTYEIPSVPSLTSLSLYGERVHEMDFDFLRLLPSLEYLRITSDGTPERLNEQNIYEPQLWQVTLPKLKEVLLKETLDDSIRQSHYTRAQYEARRRQEKKFEFN